MTKKRLSYESSEEYLPACGTAEDEMFGERPREAKKFSAAQAKALRILLENNLTKKQKCYIILYYRDGLTVKEIAEKLGVDKSTVSRTINRGRERLVRAAGREALRNLFSGNM